AAADRSGRGPRRAPGSGPSGGCRRRPDTESRPPTVPSPRSTGRRARTPAPSDVAAADRTRSPTRRASPVPPRGSPPGHRRSARRSRWPCPPGSVRARPASAGPAAGGFRTTATWLHPAPARAARRAPPPGLLLLAGVLAHLLPGALVLDLGGQGELLRTLPGD